MLSRIYILFLVFISTSSSWAQVPSDFRITNGTLRIYFSSDFNDLADEHDSQESRRHTDAFSIEAKLMSLMALSEDGYFEPKQEKDRLKKIQTEILSQTTQIEKAVSEHFQKTVQAFQPKVFEQDGGKIYHVEDGVGFLLALIQHEDPLVRWAMKALIADPDRQARHASAPEKLIGHLLKSRESRTFLLDAESWREQDLKRITDALAGTNYRFEKIHNKYYLFGGGFSYFILRGILMQGFSLKDQDLKQKFERLVRYRVSRMVPTIFDSMQGPVAYSNPIEKLMAYVAPGQSGLNADSHEMTHVRFEEFTFTLKKWIQKKGYVVPYEINGPPRDSFSALFNRFGGLFNLLNEVNAWRIGESFDGDADDAKILENLTHLYGRQAGHEAADMVAKVWTPSRLAGKSVAYIIYSEIKRLNNLKPQDIIYLGLESVYEKDLIKQMNFLLLVEAKKIPESDARLMEEAKFVAEEIIKVSDHERVLKAAHSFLKKEFQSNGDPSLTKNDAKPSLEKFGFEELWKGYVQTGAPILVDEIYSRFVDRITETHIADIVKWALHSRATTHMNYGVAFLAAVFSHNGIHDVITDGVARDPIPSSDPRAKFIQALDAVLNQQLYTEQTKIDVREKADLMNFLALRLHPRELPKTFANTAYVLSSPMSDLSHRWMARHFFRVSSLEGHRQITWGETLIQGLRGRSLPLDVVDSFTYFYKDGLAPYFGKDTAFGIYASARYDGETRTRVLRDIVKMSPQDKDRLQTAARNLWELIGIESSRVKVSAVYALLSHPSFVLANEDRILHAIENKDARYLGPSAFVLDVVGPDFLPKVAKKVGLAPETKRKSTKIEKPQQCQDLFAM